VTIAWTLYTHDNNDVMPLNTFPTPLARAWTYDLQTWWNWDDTTNVAKLMAPEYSSLGDYSKNPEVYLCPADHYVSAEQKAAGITRRIRNISLNLSMGGPCPQKQDYWSIWEIYDRVAKLTDSANRYVFIDEHPDTIHRGYFEINGNRFGPMGFISFPSPLHNGGATLSFADAHAEYKKWRGEDSKKPVEFRPMPVRVSKEKQDYLWLWRRTGDVFY
jgi:prepilin-type processing-associated H-X9-DG protein